MMNSNLPGLFLHSSHNPQRLRPGSAHFHLTYRINHFPHCNPKSAHKLKCLQYDLRKALAPPWLHVFSMIAKFITGRASNHTLASIWNVEQVPSFFVNE